MKKTILLSAGDNVMMGYLEKKLGKSIIIANLEEGMEEKIKKAKELKIKAVESEVAIEKTEEPIIDKGNQDYLRTANAISLTKKQAKARAGNKRARKARKINRKS